MSDSQATAVQNGDYYDAVRAPTTPVSTAAARAQPSTVQSSPDIARPHFHFRSSLTATPTSNPTVQASPAASLHTHRAPRATSSLPQAPTAPSKARAASSFHRLHEESTLTLQRRRTKERKSRIQQTFLLLSSCSIVLLCLLLVYYNYLLLAPQLTSLFWAVLFSLLLSRPQQLLVVALEGLDVRLEGKKHSIAACAAALAAIAVGLSRANIVVCVVAAVLLVLAVAVLYGERQHLVSVFLLIFVVLLIAFPLAFFLKTCVDETQEISRRVRAFINNNPQFEHLLRNFTSSTYYARVLAHASHLGVSEETLHSYLDPSSLKTRLATLTSSLSDQLSVVLSGALSMLAQLSNTLISLVSFLGFLYYLLDNRSAWLSGLLSLSPFSEEENARLGGEMRRSVQSIFICSFLIGLLHAVSTFIAFRLVGIDLCLILSFLAGFCAMLPIFSSWLVWAPAIVSLLCLNRTVPACLLLLIQLVLCYYLDPIVYSRIRPEQSSLIGMSIVFGIGAFGSTGVVVGPLLTTVTLTLCNIYIEYVQAPLPHAGRLSSGSGGGRKSSEVDSDLVRLSPATDLQKQWTGDEFPTFFQAAVDTPAASTKLTPFHDSEAATQRIRSRPQQKSTPLEPPSPLAWQANPLGRSIPPSTSSSAIPSPAAADVHHIHPPTAPQGERGNVHPHEQLVNDQRSEESSRRFLLIDQPSPTAGDSNGNGAHKEQPHAASLPTARPVNSRSRSDGRQASDVTDVISSDNRAFEGVTVADGDTTVRAATGPSIGPTSVAARRPATLQPLRLKEEDDDPSAVPNAVFIHQSDDEGPDSGFNLSADVVDSTRERKERVIMVPLSTRSRKKLLSADAAG